MESDCEEDERAVSSLAALKMSPLAKSLPEKKND